MNYFIKYTALGFLFIKGAACASDAEENIGLYDWCSHEEVLSKQSRIQRVVIASISSSVAGSSFEAAASDCSVFEEDAANYLVLNSD